MSEEENYKVRGSPKAQQLRTTPQNELDLQLMTTDPKWGDWNIPDELKEVLGSTEVFFDESGNQYMDINSLWGLFGFYTRDLRLGNLPYWSGEVPFVEEHINFAGDCITGLEVIAPKIRAEGLSDFEYKKMCAPMNFRGAFMQVFRPAITKLEVSQSRGGFLRKRHGTLTSENFQNGLEPEKKGFFKQKSGGYK